MTLIYQILDNTSGKVYVGSTNQTINQRMSTHKSKNNMCSSKEIIKNNDYEVSIIEECINDVKQKREQYYIDKLDCVNIKNALYDEKEYLKNYRIIHKKDKRDYDMMRRKWIMSFGETKRDVCNVFYISDTIFS